MARLPNYASIDIDSPVGQLRARFCGTRIVGLWHREQRGFPDENQISNDTVPAHAAAGLRQWLAQYFAGDEPDEGLITPEIQGTDFAMRVYRALQTLPRGEMITYGGLARAIGKPRTARAVGRALGANPLLLIVPCHRVVAAHSLGGFAAPMVIKEFLLTLEGADLCAVKRRELKRPQATDGGLPELT
ncbi:methylated-DNA--[protein]-cysteine S-methyltransferase [Corynebacterium sp. ES2794-CONJ1]|uniref:methylated-DNA--[protein]-cysteine S-methyltransferase n=1 Tax=unclassified Corynebacterium TaxID=2624378 RepID=UPI00216B190C|nr:MULTISPECIES: methylated-DNA--[protein]-cysteine S-methyltransferase [unclassified Corynebacterium]MCS4531222.1 methylated-DNA--[protein]-cysteine S-methyltransferase [Corynebacterium sp. ES2730-CONJ]MCU9518590.1 methylated-DNA--[protein]-cysteine S-methyltransferase [Corynebacterium sp. ES2794-CONJ1]